jgi:hypothetical protein
MPSPYSEDLRHRVVNAIESGETTHEVGAIFQVSPGALPQPPISVGYRTATLTLSRSAVTDKPYWNSMRVCKRNNYRSIRP